MNTSDEALMGQVKLGDVRKLAVLFEKHHRSLYNFFRHMSGDADLSQDLTQEVFFRMLRYRSTYDESRPFAAWMYQIARNTRAESVQKRRGELRFVPDLIEDLASPRPLAHETMERSQEIRLLRRALEQLPAAKREVLVLSRFQNLKYESIAEILGCEPGTVKVRVYRAVRALGEIYSQLAGEQAS